MQIVEPFQLEGRKEGTVGKCVLLFIQTIVAQVELRRASFRAKKSGNLSGPGFWGPNVRNDPLIDGRNEILWIFLNTFRRAFAKSVARLLVVLSSHRIGASFVHTLPGIALACPDLFGTLKCSILSAFDICGFGLVHGPFSYV